MYKSFSNWLEFRIDEASLDMKHAVNASFAAHLNADRIGLHNLKGSGARRISPTSKMGHRLSSDHIVVVKKGAYAMWSPDNNVWVALPVDLMPAKEILFGKMDKAIQPKDGVTDYDFLEPTGPHYTYNAKNHDKRDDFHYDRPRTQFES